MTGGVDRLRRLLLRLVPARVTILLARAHRPIARSLAARRSRTAGEFRWNSKIDPRDELAQFGMAQLVAQGASFTYYRSLRRYFEGGRLNLSEIENVLAGAGAPLAGAGSVLEFACGWGRVTRHLVGRVDPACLTVSDIDRSAVDFVRQTFGVGGFYSTSEPEELVNDQRYELILVVSLFSHLPLRSWTRWLRRLEAMLTPGGVLVFSTIPWETGDEPPVQEQRAAFEAGMLYSEVNETDGRLQGREYGTAFTRTAFVETAVAEHFTGTLVKHVPRGLNGVQDVYVLRHTPAATLSS